MTDTEKSLATIAPMGITDFNQSYNGLIKFVTSKLKLDTDYGIIPGTKKKSLYKPGAEKIAFLFNLKPQFELIKEVEDWETGFFYYKYKCTLIHFSTGKIAGEAVRSCNSMEKKYAYSTKPEKWASEEEKKNAFSRKQNTKYGTWDLIIKKTPEEKADQANTIEAMAQKRAVVAAVVHSTMATEIFDATSEELNEEAPAPDAPVTKAEDPARVNAMSKLYAVASERGFEPEQVKKTAAYRYKIESMTEVSNAQIVEMTEDLLKSWEIVGKGNKAQKVIKSDNLVIAQEPIEVEVIETKYLCKGTKHIDGEDVETTIDNPWCSTDCRDEYYPTKAPNRLEQFIQSGGKKEV